MNYQQERDEFLTLMAQEGLPLNVTRAILSKAATIQRLSEAECNGDYPCDNGERKVEFCTDCGSGYVRTAMQKRGERLICRNCLTKERIAYLLSTHTGFKAVFQGDPRGACVKIAVPSGKTNDIGRDGICVPTRSR